MKKRLFLLFTAFIFVSAAFSAPKNASSKTIDYIKGNIAEKTAAVRDASGEEGLFLSKKALEFAIENKEYLGNDRELDGLVISAILSIPDDYFSSENHKSQGQAFLDSFTEVFQKFSDSQTVQIAVIQKYVQLKNRIETKSFTALLNAYIQKLNPASQNDAAIIKALINAFEALGDRESFVILYNFWNNKRYASFYDDIEKSLVSLSEISINEIIQIIHSKDINQLCKVFALVQKNSRISKNLICEIAENALAESILLVDSTSKYTNEVSSLQRQSLEILESNSWTRASSIAIDYMRFCKKLYDSSVIDEKYFAFVIASMSNISPIESVNQLCAFLEEFNNRKEKDEKVSDAVVKAVIDTLGAIGNKSAFDYLLAVTYLSYSDEVLSAARDALAGLRWQ